MEKIEINSRQILDTVPIDIPLEKIGEKYGQLRITNPTAEQSMQKSLETYGQLSPIVVCKNDENRYELLDGFKRVHGIRKIRGLDKVKGRAVSLKGQGCKAAILLLNNTNNLTDMEEAFVVQSLHREDGLAQVDIAILLDRHPSWVCRRISLVEQSCEEIQESIKLGLIGPRIGQEVTKLPRGNQKPVLLSIQNHGLTSREVEKLVSALLYCQKNEYEKILKDPHKILDKNKKDKRNTKDNRLSSAGQSFNRQLLALEDSSLSVSKINNAKELSYLTENDIVCLSPVIGRVLRSVESSIDNLQKILTIPQNQTGINNEQ